MSKNQNGPTVHQPVEGLLNDRFVFRIHGRKSFIEHQKGVAKVYPILDWNDRETYRYLPDNDLPYHPLEGKGYDSLGDWHSTKKLSEVESREETRHAGHKRECGLHEELPEGYGFDI